MQIQNAAIAANAAISGEIVLSARRTIALVPLAGFSGTSISFLVSPDNTNFYPMCDEKGVEITLTVAAGKMTTLTNDLAVRFDAAKFMKIVSGTNAVPVNQTAAVTVEVITHDPQEF